MSNLLYNEVPGYYKDQYKEYCISNDKEIKGFQGEYRWLSNFPNCQILFNGVEYKCPEAAYQAQKIIPEQREEFGVLNGSQSKKFWKQDRLIKLYAPEQWDKVKLDIMKGITFEKYYRNLNLRTLLLTTNDRYLEESNMWHDNYFGVCYCNKCKDKEKFNNLGKILMKVREFWK